MYKRQELPIFNWVWFGLYRSEGGLNGYTYGMDVFGKEEMEVLNTDAEPEELRDFLAKMCIRDSYHPHKPLNQAIAQHLMQGDLQENLDAL